MINLIDLFSNWCIEKEREQRIQCIRAQKQLKFESLSADHESKHRVIASMI